MGSRKTASIDPAAPLTHTVGEPEYNRRLADKILAAFNHAYAVGAVDVAESLRRILEEVESLNRRDRRKRRNADTLDQAALWMAFVEARNRYKQATGDGETTADETARALGEMKEAYKRWSYA